MTREAVSEHDKIDDDATSEESSALAKHLLESNKYLEVSRKNWNLKTREFKYVGSKGIYVIRGFKFAPNSGYSDFGKMKYEWPNTFVHSGEPEPVCGALFFQGTVDTSYDQCILVGIWAFSPGGDETSMYYLEEYEEDISSLEENFDIITDPLCSDAFCVSSGIESVECFHCPVLDVLEKQDPEVIAVHDLTFLEGTTTKLNINSNSKRKLDDL